MEAQFGAGATEYEPWADAAAVRRKLDNWWALLLTDRRRQILAAAAGDTLPDWLAQALIRVGLPLQLNAGFTDPRLAGRFVTPRIVKEFFDEKRASPLPKWWQFWR